MPGIRRPGCKADCSTSAKKFSGGESNTIFPMYLTGTISSGIICDKQVKVRQNIARSQTSAKKITKGVEESGIMTHLGRVQQVNSNIEHRFLIKYLEP